MMNKPATSIMEDEWFCTTVLLGVFQGAKTLQQCTAASKRIVASGISREYLRGLAMKSKKINWKEDQFFQLMLKRDFAIEQVITFLDAPRDAASFATKTRKQIMEDITREWKSMPAAILTGASNRGGALGALVVTAGLVAGTITWFYGKSINNQDVQNTALELAEIFPTFVSQSLDTMAGQLVGVGLAMAAGSIALKVGKKLLEHSNTRSKARGIRLEDTLAQDCLPRTVAHQFSDFTSTLARLNEIPAAHRNLLSHLSGAELRVFLHNSDDLRREMLTARPPSYSQRIACISAMDSNFFSRWRQQMILVTSSWQGPLAQGPATLKNSLLAMRNQKHDTSVSTPDKPYEARQRTI